MVTLKVSAVLAPATVSVPERPKITWQSCKYDEAAEAAEQARIRRDEPEEGRTVASQKQASQEAERAEREKQQARICEERAIAQADIEAQWANAAAAQNSAAIAGAFFKWSAVEVLAVLLAVGAAFWAAIEARRSANVAEDAANAEAIRHADDIKRADDAAAKEGTRRDAEAALLKQQTADARRVLRLQNEAELFPERLTIWFTQSHHGTLQLNWRLSIANGGNGTAHNVAVRVDADIYFPKPDWQPWLKEPRWVARQERRGNDVPKNGSIEVSLAKKAIWLQPLDTKSRGMAPPDSLEPGVGDPRIGSRVDSMEFFIEIRWDSLLDQGAAERRGPYRCSLFDLDIDLAAPGGFEIEENRPLIFIPVRDFESRPVGNGEG